MGELKREGRALTQPQLGQCASSHSNFSALCTSKNDHSRTTSTDCGAQNNFSKYENLQKWNLWIMRTICFLLFSLLLLSRSFFLPWKCTLSPTFPISLNPQISPMALFSREYGLKHKTSLFKICLLLKEKINIFYLANTHPLLFISSYISCKKVVPMAIPYLMTKTFKTSNHSEKYT